MARPLKIVAPPPPIPPITGSMKMIIGEQYGEASVYGVCTNPNGKVWAALDTTPAIAVKVDALGFKEEDFVDLNFSSLNEWHGWCAIVIGAYLYVGSGSAPAVSKVNLSSLLEVASIGLGANDRYPECFAQSGNYLYVCCNGGGLFPGSVAKIDLTTFSYVSSRTVGAGVERARWIAISGGFLYAAIRSSPGKVVKVDLSSFSIVGTLTFAEDYVSSLEIVGGYLYAGLETSPGIVKKVDLSLFSEVDSLPLGAGENDISCLEAVGGYLYAGLLAPSPSMIAKINLATFHEDAVLTLAAGENELVHLTAYGNYLFGANWDAPGVVLRINLSTFTEDPALNLQPGEGNAHLLVDGHSIYAGTASRYVPTPPGRLLKIDPATLTRRKTIELPAAEVQIYDLALYGGYLYATIYSSPARLKKVDLSTFTVADTLTLLAGENKGYSLAIAWPYLYMGLDTSPGKIVKIDLTSFSRVGTLTLLGGEDQVRALHIVGNFLYAGLITFPGKVVKVDLTSFSRVGALTFGALEDQTYALVDSGGFLYAGLYTNPCLIKKIDLSLFAVVNTLALQAGYDGIRDHGLTVSGSYMYAILNSDPARIEKIDLTHFTRIAAQDFNMGYGFWEIHGTNMVEYLGSLYAALDREGEYGTARIIRLGPAPPPLPSPSAVTTVLSAGSITLGGSITDTVTVTGIGGGYPDPTGTVDFQVSVDGGATWAKFGATKTLVAGVATSDSYTPLAPGTYYFRAVYSGDDNYSSAASGATAEPLTVNKATPTVVTALSASLIPLGGSVTDDVTVTGLGGSFPGPTGTVDFQVLPPGGSWTKFGATKTLVGGSATSDSYTPPNVGIYYFRAVYSGDSNYNGATSTNVEALTVATILFSDDFETGLGNWADWGTVNSPPSGVVWSGADFHSPTHSAYFPAGTPCDMWLLTPLPDWPVSLTVTYWLRAENASGMFWQCKPMIYLQNKDGNYNCYVMVDWHWVGGLPTWYLEVLRNPSESPIDIDTAVHQDALWHKFEVHVEWGPAGSTTKLYIDDVLAAEYSDNVPYSQPLDELELYHFPNDNTGTYWDDVVIATP